MNNYIIIPILCSIFPFTIFTGDNFNIILKPKWQNLDSDEKKIIDFDEMWVLVGSITFKKKSKEPICIETLNLRWNGQTITNLMASLYKKDFSKEFLPIEKNLVCDGVWSKTKQMLIFNFDEKETLAPTTTFYLVLTIPETLETILESGSFVLEEQCLPKPFKHCSQSCQLSLVINDTKNLSTPYIS